MDKLLGKCAETSIILLADKKTRLLCGAWTLSWFVVSGSLSRFKIIPNSVNSDLVDVSTSRWFVHHLLIASAQPCWPRWLGRSILWCILQCKRWLSAFYGHRIQGKSHVWCVKESKLIDVKGTGALEEAIVDFHYSPVDGGPYLKHIKVSHGVQVGLFGEFKKERSKPETETAWGMNILPYMQAIKLTHRVIGLINQGVALIRPENSKSYATSIHVTVRKYCQLKYLTDYLRRAEADL